MAPQIKFLEFWKLCIKNAFRGSYLVICGWAGPPISIIVTIIQSYNLVPKGFTFLDTNIAVVVPVLATVLFFTIRLIREPVLHYRASQRDVSRLSARLHPSLKFSIKDPEGTDECTWVTNQTMGGYRTHHPHLNYANALCLLVENTSAVRVGPCVGVLFEASRLEEGQWVKIGLDEPVRLAWSTNAPEEHLQAFIEPEMTARLWIASINYNGYTWLIRDLNNLHSVQHTIFGEAGTYRASIQVSDGTSEPTRIQIELTTSPDQSRHHMHPGIVVAQKVPFSAA
ncbi:hypothetical protein GG681_17545 [Epibacterium sp. SM1969]|uniref:Uncharacterized protein n=1 Tax=Tritonibacter aquimaris TaxID=2663379 RepID=A0A844B307_9RHOB|nr:hypothetical protein [Tritonibacter aquimaris]MQY44451.1 hypothetical protein [Tritonibacter aquimaris]